MIYPCLYCSTTVVVKDYRRYPTERLGQGISPARCYFFLLPRSIHIKQLTQYYVVCCDDTAGSCSAGRHFAIRGNVIKPIVTSLNPPFPNIALTSSNSIRLRASEYKERPNPSFSSTALPSPRSSTCQISHQEILETKPNIHHTQYQLTTPATRDG